MKRKLLAGTTSLKVRIFVQDSSVTTGAGLTGLTSASGGLTWYYCRNGDSSTTSVTLASGTLGTYTSGGLVAVDGTNMPGVYEIGVPNAAIAAGADSVHMMLSGAANMVPVLIEIELDAVNYQDAVHFGLSSLPNMACTANASLLTSGNGTDQLSVSAGKVLLQATQAGVTIPTVTAVTGQLTAAQIATGVWQDATAGDFTAASSIGKALFVNAAPGAAGGHFLSGTNAATTVNFTGNLSGSVGSVTGAVGSVAGNVGGNVAGSVASVTGAVGSVTAAVTVGAIGSGVITTAAFAAGALTSAVLAAGCLDSVAIESGVNLPQAIAIIAAACAGQSSGVAAGSPLYQALNNPGTTRISATASNGDRSSVTLTLPSI